jgi:hypothetical protein
MLLSESFIDDNIPLFALSAMGCWLIDWNVYEGAVVARVEVTIE